MTFDGLPSPSGEGLGVGRIRLTETGARGERPHPNPSPEGEGLPRIEVTSSRFSARPVPFLAWTPAFAWEGLYGKALRPCAGGQRERRGQLYWLLSNDTTAPALSPSGIAAVP